MLNAHAHCSKLGRSCFAAGTPIRTAEGSRPVEAFRPCDRLLSRCEHTPFGPAVERAVEAVFVRAAPVLRLQVRGVRIGTTAEHPFWARGRGWVAAGLLRVGDVLIGSYGRRHAVELVEETGAVDAVYNFRVAESNTCFVGSDDWDFNVWASTACG